MLLNYHIGRLVLSSLCVGDLVRLVLSSARVVKKLRDTLWTGSAQEPVASCCEHGNEPPFSIKHRELLDPLGDYKLLNEDTDL